MHEFKDIIRNLRIERDLKQSELASKIGVSQQTVTAWESGSRLPSVELIELIADYFNVDTDYLYGRSEVRKAIHVDEDGLLHYYINEETAETAQEIFENDRILFDVYRSADKDRLVEYAKRLSDLRKMEEGE